jgi:hypothetical protein
VVIPLSGRVPRRASRPSRSCVDDGGGLQYVFWKRVRPLGFSRRGEYIGGRAMSWGGLGAHTTWWRGQGVARATLWRGCPLAPPLPPSLLWTPSRVGKNRNFGFCFVQFREYFMCNFSKTQKQQKTGTGTVASR